MTKSKNRSKSYQSKSRSPAPSPSPSNSKSRSPSSSRKHKKKEKKDRKAKKEPNYGIWMGIKQRFGHLKDKWHKSPLTEYFKTDNVVQLINRESHKALRVTDFGQIDCLGEKKAEHDEQLHFVVINHGSNIVSLRSLTFPMADEKYLRVKSDGKLSCSANSRNDECKFRIHETADNWITLENYAHMFHHIAAKKDGSIIAPKRAFEKTKACEFDVKIIGQHKKTPAGWKVIKMDN